MNVSIEGCRFFGGLPGDVKNLSSREVVERLIKYKACLFTRMKGEFMLAENNTQIVKALVERYLLPKRCPRLLVLARHKGMRQ